MREIKTGRKDKNGKEIYENDEILLDIWSEPLLVSFWYGKWVAVYKPTCRSEVEGECKYDDLFSLQSEHIEVIGNIHERGEE